MATFSTGMSPSLPLHSAVSRARNVVKVNDKRPQIDVNTFVATNATVIGDVSLANVSQVWFGAVVKGIGFFVQITFPLGEDAPVKIGHNTSIMDNAVVSAVKVGYNNLPGSVTIGNDTQIGTLPHRFR